jgi:hypothetical protein
MQDYEKLGAFYLGRPYDLASKKRGEGWLLYDSRDLVTHAVCVGMTGSGKTGLCLALLEEAAIDGVPAIAIDPKGDLGNLLLTFPALQPADFEPWVNPDDARRAGVSVPEFAAQQAAKWKKGLEEWGQDGERIARLRAAADFAIYTPGSEAGLPVSILKTLAAPGADVEGEALRERVATTVGGLLGLLGLDADPVRSRDHILLSTILQNAWSRGEDLDLAALIQQIQAPPVARVGVIDLESFYPSKDRFALAMALNNLLASPGFASWMEGEPLDVQRLLYTADGRPRVSIFSIAHLGDAERMFFVSLLLGQVVGWMRQQSGTASLRALVYMDEIFGYFPPVANPPSKQPLLTLLKQGRAFGVGTVLATQNPVDLDYKGLANAGTWFLGRLQTERDKARVIEGLEGASASAGKSFDRGRMEQTLAGLGSRVFLMNDVHEEEPVVFESRWAMSYLRGPLGRQEIRKLMEGRKQQAAGEPATAGREAVTGGAPAVPAPVPGAPPEAPRATRAAAAANPATEASSVSARPVIPPGVDQFYLPVRGSAPPGARLVYRPMLLGSAQVRFADPKAGVDRTDEVSVVTAVTDEAVPVDWSAAEDCPFAPADLEREAAEGAAFAQLPPPALKPKSYDAWKKAFGTWVYGARKLAVLRAPEVGLVSEPGESEGQFRVRVQQAARERRDQAVEALRQKYAARLAQLQGQLQRAQAARDRESSQATAQKLQTAISFGATLLGAFMGRKAASVSTLGRATTAARGVGRTMKEAEDVKRAGLTVEAVQQQIDAIESELRAEAAALDTKLASGPFESLTVAPKKTGITVQLVALTWTPVWVDPAGRETAAM